jgi:tetratricopeptide (TPR) repeat protein
MHMVRVGMILMILAVLVAPAAAEDRALARQAYSEGTKFYDLNQFAEALEAFKRAYWNYEEPVFLFNIAQCHRALGHKSDALGFYRSYLRKAPDAPNRDDVQRIITDLEGAIARDKSAAASRAAAESAAATKASASATAHPALVATPPAKTEKPKPKRAWVWGVVAGAVAVAVGVGVGVGVGTQSHAPKASDGAVSF